jgi:hypothetical protein
MPRRCLLLLTAVVMLSAALASAADLPEDQTLDLIPTVNLVPPPYRHRLVQQLSIAEDNEQSLLKAIATANPAHREAMAFLLINMPEADLKSLKGNYLLNNVELAYQAREATPWGNAIPKEIFFRDVLPYANLDETREDWRKNYFDRFMPLVKDAKNASDAAMILNKDVFPAIKVKYHATKRLKPNQSPAESAKIGYASCTGLSIILVDACRAVGVPARVAGTALWNDKNGGNHTWTEVWDHQWYFIGSAEPGPLDQTWFVDNAAKADPSRPETRIYAVSFEHADTSFPMVWDMEQKDVSAEDVTDFYKDRQTLSVTAPANTRIEIRQADNLMAATSAADANFSLAAGKPYTVTLQDHDGKTIKSRTITLSKIGGSSVNFSF